jgi:ATP-dependent Clp protease adaptor protein ClpS
MEAMSPFFSAQEWNPDGGDSGIAVQEGRPKLKEPRRYLVFLLNDDYTTMEFVVDVLKHYFHKSEAQALEIMLKVHDEGRGVAGVYSHEIAETKVAQVEEYAQKQGFPLKCTIEPE